MYRVTQVLSVGPFATVERADALRAAGVTHILNVSGGPSHLAADTHGFKRVSWIALDDFERLPPHTTVELLDTLHGMASQPGAHVYVHCVAGHLRSPTVLWLYLIAMGLRADDARDLIEDRAPSAVPGHHRMVDHQHVLLAQTHGLANFFPHPRPEIVVPFQLPGGRSE